jgi:hypothetical protein
LVTLLGNGDSRVDCCGEVVSIEIGSVADLEEERIIVIPRSEK